MTRKVWQGFSMIANAVVKPLAGLNASLVRKRPSSACPIGCRVGQLCLNPVKHQPREIPGLDCSMSQAEAWLVCLLKGRSLDVRQCTRRDMWLRRDYWIPKDEPQLR